MISSSINDILRKIKANDPFLKELDLRQTEINTESLEALEQSITQCNTVVGNIHWNKEALLFCTNAESLVTNIEKKLLENNKKYEKYPGDYTYSLLSRHVYYYGRNKKDLASGDEIIVSLEFNEKDEKNIEQKISEGWTKIRVRELEHRGVERELLDSITIREVLLEKDGGEIGTKFEEQDVQMIKKRLAEGWDEVPKTSVILEKKLKGWKVLEIFDDTNGFKFGNDCSGYYAIAYINEDKHQVVLAHMGTTSHLRPLAQDMIEVLGGKVGKQIIDAYEATKKSVQHAKEKNYRFSTTGHSLGGWLAELSIYFSHVNFQYHNIKSVTFDSPGSWEMMDNFKSNIINRETLINLDTLDITTYLSIPNPVNSCNRHVGTVYALFPKLSINKEQDELSENIEISSENRQGFLSLGIDLLKKGAKKGVDLVANLGKKSKELLKEGAVHLLTNGEVKLDLLLTAEGHSLQLIIQTFNPALNRPYEYYKVLDWPKINYSSNAHDVGIVGAVQGSLENIPIIGSIIKSVGGLLHKHALCDIVKVLYDIYDGKFDFEQYSKAIYSLDKTTGIGTSHTTKEEGELRYVAHYNLQKVDEVKSQLNSYKGNVDWYLEKFYKYRNYIETLELAKSIKEQLLDIVLRYEIIPDYQKTFIQSTSLEVSASQIRDRIERLVDVSKQDLTDAINKLSSNEEVVERLGVDSNFPLQREEVFVGRQEYISRIGEEIRKKNVVVITGKKGVGKTALSIEYAYRAQERGIILRWFNADTKDKIYNGYLALARELEINENTDRKILKQTIHNKLRNNKLLFIFDGVEKDSAEFIKNSFDYFTPNIEVIITSNQEENLNLFSNNCRIILLPPLTKVHAMKYIKERLGNERKVKFHEREMLVFATARIEDNHEEYIPFDLENTISYLREYPEVSVDKYITHYNDYKKSGIEQNLAMTLSNCHSIEFFLFAHFIYLDASYIPSEIIRTLSIKGSFGIRDIYNTLKKLERLSIIKKCESDYSIILENTIMQGNVKNIINILREKSVLESTLANIRQYLPTKVADFDLFVSQLTDVVKPQMSKDLQENIDLAETRVLERIIESINSLFPYVEETPDERWQKARLYAPHAIKIFGVINSQEVVFDEKILGLNYAELLTKLGTYYELVTSEYDEALKAYGKAKELSVTLYGLDSLELANLCYSIGRTYNALQFSEVSSLTHEEQTLSNLKNALLIYKLHKHNLEAARAANIIGHTLYIELYELCSKDTSYKDDEKVEEILTYYDEALNILRIDTTQGTALSMLDMAESIDNIGLAYELFDDKKPLSSEQEQILIARRKCLEVPINEGFKSFQNEALIYVNRALEIRKSHFPNHPKVAESYYNKGCLHKDLHDDEQNQDIEHLNEALECFTKARDINEKLYGPTNPDVANCLQEIGAIYYAMDKVQEALELFSQALLVNEKLYGKIHIKSTKLLESMAAAYYSQNKKEEALNCVIQLVSILEKLSLEPDHIKYLHQSIARLEQEIATQAVINQEPTTVEIAGSGLSLSYPEQAFGYSNTFNKYYNIGVDKILTLRINDEKIGLIEAKYCLEDLNIIVQKVDTFFSKRTNTVLVPCNVDKRHWIGLIFEKLENSIVSVKYIDSENNKILLLEKTIKEHLNLIGYQDKVIQLKVEGQLANNCGPEVIENFMLYLTGSRHSQEEAVKAHSQLYEQYLLEDKKEVSVEVNNEKESKSKFPTLYLGYEWIENKVTSAIVSTISNALELAVSTADKIEELVQMCIPGEQPDWNIAKMLFYTDLLNFALESGGMSVPFSRRPHPNHDPDDSKGHDDEDYEDRANDGFAGEISVQANFTSSNFMSNYDV